VIIMLPGDKYGQLDDRVSRGAGLPATQVAATQPANHELIPIIGLTLAFFSTLLLATNIMVQGARD
jgi:hypothetical protein